MAIKNLELMNVSYPQHLCMGTARMKEDKFMDEKVKREE